MSGAEIRDRARPLLADDLAGAPLAEVLLYGLALDDEDPALGVLLAARRDLGLIANLAERIRLGAGLDLDEVAPALEQIGRRLDVGLELLVRAQRTRLSTSVDKPDEEPESRRDVRASAQA